ncbi:MAG TPA: HEAT repeat domain-containing protein [Ktedonobacteraceae bacterium]|nr:HEAT repeat domain-containing protein [Ktedonobacteraceae bacterium]
MSIAQRIAYLRDRLQQNEQLNSPAGSYETVGQPPEADVGNLGLILALRSLVEGSSADMPMEQASQLIARWAEGIIDAARLEKDRRYERLFRLAHEIRLLDTPLVEAGVKRLTAAMLDPGEPERVRCQVARTLGELGRHVPVLAFLACLRTSPISLSMTIEDALQAIESQTPIEPLLTAILDSDEHWGVSEQAAYLLGRQGRPEAVPALVQAAKDDDSLACHAIDALALLGAQAPIDVLKDILLYDNNWSGWKRIHAARALGKLGQADILLTALYAFQDAEDSTVAQARLVCSEIVEALIPLPITIPVEQLTSWLSDKRSYLNLLASEKLAQLNLPAPVDPPLAIPRRPVQSDEREKQKAQVSALHLLNKQTSPVPAEDLLTLLQENRWPLQSELSELQEAFCLLGTRAPVDALREILTSASNGKAFQALSILKKLHQDIPLNLLFARYDINNLQVDSRDAVWGRELIRFGEPIPAEMLVTIACSCEGLNDDDDLDDAMAAELGQLGGYIADALLAKLPEYAILDSGFLPKVARLIYEHLPHDRLLAALRKSEGDVCTAAGILAVAGDDRYLPVLRSLLEDKASRPSVVCKILSALAPLKEHYPLDVLLTALLWELPCICQTAVDILRDLRGVLPLSELVEPLEAEILARKDEPERFWYAGNLVEALGLCGEYTPVAFLVELLEDETLYSEAAEALVEASQHVPIEVFLTMLCSPNDLIRENAIVGIGKERERVPIDQLLRLLSLNMNNENPPEEQCEEEADESEEEEGRRGIVRAIIEALTELDEHSSIQQMKMSLQHEDEQVCRGARRALAELEGRGPRERLIRDWLAHFEDELTRPSVIASQVASGEQASFDVWIELLNKEEDEKLAAGAARVLDALAEAAPAKIATLAPECDLPAMRMARLRAWGVLGQGEEIIVAARSEKNFQVRQRAIEILGDMRYPGAREPLLHLLRDEHDSRLLLTVIDALGKLGDAVPAAPLLESCGYRDHEWRDECGFRREPAIAAANVLKQTHPEAFRTLIPLAEAILSGDPPAGVFASRTQSRLADAIGAIGHTEPSLMAILTELLVWPYWQVQMKAAQALGQLRRNVPDAALQRLLALRHDPHSRAVREAADEALSEILSFEIGM